MTSIYQEVLGSKFNELHPQIQRRFGFSSKDGIAAIGKGVMAQVWRGRFYTVPFLYVGAWRNIMFPASGQNVPFSVENYAYCDGYGRETVTWIRTFHFPEKIRRFDATMIYSHQRNLIVDYLGSHQHLAVDIHLSVAENGGMQIRSGEQRFYEGKIGFRFPMLFSGYANVSEWYDDATEKFQIEVSVQNRIWGPLFGYRGSFDVEYLPVTEVPAGVKPWHEELRE